jgi:hypothetical protein
METTTPHFNSIHPLPSREEIAAKFSYDPETGVITNRRTGYVYRHRSEGGYARLMVGKRSIAGHWIAWMLTHGRWPYPMLDHINGIRHDNRLVNLREATTQQNLQSRPMHKRNKLGVKGVIREPTGAYRAQLWTNGRFVLQARYQTLPEAKAAYEAVSRVVFGEWHRL